MNNIKKSKNFIDFITLVIGFFIAKIVGDFLGLENKVFSLDFAKRVGLILISWATLNVLVFRIIDMINKIKKEGYLLKAIKINIILMGLGTIVLLFEFVFQFNNILGWLATSVGIILIGYGILYKYRKPIRFLVRFFKEV